MMWDKGRRDEWEICLTEFEFSKAMPPPLTAQFLSITTCRKEIRVIWMLSTPPPLPWATLSTKKQYSTWKSSE